MDWQTMNSPLSVKWHVSCLCMIFHPTLVTFSFVTYHSFISVWSVLILFQSLSSFACAVTKIYFQISTFVFRSDVSFENEFWDQSANLYAFIHFEFCLLAMTSFLNFPFYTRRHLKERILFMWHIKKRREESYFPRATNAPNLLLTLV